MSAADWELMGKPPVTGQPVPPEPPQHDMDAIEGQAITLGDTQIWPVSIPGHTPGSLALIFSVRDRGKEHVAGLFGGSVLISDRMPEQALKQYIASIAHYAEVARQKKVDVELQNHPLFDTLYVKLLDIRNRGPSDPNPFVVGPSEYQKFLTVMSECAQASLSRHGP
jgi:metallo-beta-lactamase class B